MNFAGERGYGETFFEARAEVDHDADDHHDHRVDAALLELLADFGPDEIGSLGELGAWVFGLQRSQHLPGHRASELVRAHLLALVFRQLQPDRNFAGAADALHHRVFEAGLHQRRTYIADVDRPFVVHLDEDAAGEIEAVVQPAYRDRPDRHQDQDRRDDDADLAHPQEVDVEIVTEDFHGFRYVSDPEGLELAATSAVDQRGNRVGHGHRGEQRNDDADGQGDAEALDGARTHRHQGDGRDEVGDVGVDDDRPRFFVAGADRSERCRTVAQFLADTFADQHVGVDGHAEGQDDARDAGHRQRHADDGHDGDEQQQVEHQRDVGHDPEQPVVDRGRKQYQRQAQDDRAIALLDVVLAEARPDHVLVDDVHRRRQRTRAQHQRQRLRFLLAQPGGLELLAEHALDHRVVQHRLGGLGGMDFLAVDELHHRRGLDVHHAHVLADVLGGEIQHLARAGRIERDVDVGEAGLLVIALRGIDQFVATHDHALLQHHRRTVLHVVQAVVGGYVAGARGLDRIHVRIVGVVFQRRGGTQRTLGRSGVLHARQFDHDPVLPLLLDQGLGNAERVDAVAQGGDVLGDGGLRELLQHVRLDGGLEPVAAARGTGVGEVEIGRFGSDRAGGTVAIVRGLEDGLHAIAAQRYRVHRNLLLAQRRTDVV